jgi:hypothetical protein
MTRLAVALLLFSAIAALLAAGAQPAAKMPRIGWLSSGSPTPDILASNVPAGAPRTRLR